MGRAQHTTEPSVEKTKKKAQIADESEVEAEEETSNALTEGSEKPARKVYTKNKAEREIRQQEKSMNTCMRFGTFKNIVRKHAFKIDPEFRFTRDALETFHNGSEALLIKFLRYSLYNKNEVTNEGRIRVEPRDLLTAVHGNDGTKPLLNEWITKTEAQLRSIRNEKRIKRAKEAARRNALTPEQRKREDEARKEATKERKAEEAKRRERARLNRIEKMKNQKKEREKEVAKKRSENSESSSPATKEKKKSKHTEAADDIPRESEADDQEKKKKKKHEKRREESTA